MGKIKTPKPKTLDMEIAIAEFYNVRQALIVPNLSWGMFHYELDLCILSKSGYATEVEIKTSKADLVKDKEKKHGHVNSKIEYLYFAIPEHLVPHIEHVPERAGILVVEYRDAVDIPRFYREAGFRCIRTRTAGSNSSSAWTADDRLKLLRLGAMRTWTLKRQLQKARKA